MYNYRLTITDLNETGGIPPQQENISRSVRGSVRYTLYDYLTTGTRIEYKIADPSGSRGMLLAQDIICRFKRIPLSLWLRYCMFKTDTWDSRIYAYENDLLYSFSIPALSGEGSRSYIMIKWDFSDSAEIRFKYGITSLTNSDLKNENKEEIKFQVKTFSILYANHFYNALISMPCAFILPRRHREHGVSRSYPPLTPHSSYLTPYFSPGVLMSLTFSCRFLFPLNSFISRE
ncbi:MAG: hypothetical protein IPH69_02675 [Bacteroidales bacterium]|nr:hypothetical protein [Bacteroidales bacterium]